MKIRKIICLPALLAASGALFAQAPAPAPAAAPAAAAPAPRPVDLTARYQRIADRIASIDAQATRADDYNTLRNLQQMYGYYYDEALWDQISDLFAEDATLEVEPHGVYVGKASIRRYFYGLTNGRQGLVQGQLNNQLQLSPVITLSADGLHAHLILGELDGVDVVCGLRHAGGLQPPAICVGLALRHAKAAVAKVDDAVLGIDGGAANGNGAL